MNFDSLAALIKFIPSVLTNFKGKDLSKQNAAQAQMANLANAQYDQNNPLFQQVYNQERQAGQQDIASVIAEASRQNRKLSSLGRTPLFSQERGGEEMFRNLTKGYQDVQGTARDRAFNILRGGQNAQTGVYNAAQSLSGDQFQNKQRQLLGYGNIADLLKTYNSQPEMSWQQQEVQGLPWRTTSY